ncbi:MAG: phosphoenolpyruvate carboxylase, partial [Terrimicrobiaceae bacterium]|nr:phosphoenolpyruvate carboxylase [Terrimicrobiaceae bacterium]
QKYSKISTAVYHLELLLAGAAAYSGGPQEAMGAVFPWQAAWEILAPASHQAYRRLVEHPGFLDFYSQATPIDALETSRIGSRPSRRDGQRTLGSLRAIPWVFSWNQSRFFLPGWYGTGTALEALKTQEPGVFEEMRVNPRRCPFSYYVFSNVETNAVSADEEIMRLYAGLVGDAAVREAVLGLILDELGRTRRMLAELLGSTFAQRRPRMHRTLALRAGALRILHERQVAILREWRAARGVYEEAAARLFPRVMLSINAIASGLRTTG